MRPLQWLARGGGLAGGLAVALTCAGAASHAGPSMARAALPCLGPEAPFARAGRLPVVDGLLVDLATTSTFAGGRGREGILGTDVTSRLGVAIDYGRSMVHRADRASFCSAAELARAGLAPLSSAGFFASDPAALRSLGDVVAGAEGRTVPNVPTVPLRVAGVVARAQLDTGFDDALSPLSINVNEALFQAMAERDPDALVRAPEEDLSLTTCVGTSEPVTAYRLARASVAELLGEAGEPVHVFRGVTLFVKRTPEAARRCGGVGTWTAPAAQLGASALAQLGLVVFDPFGSRVWTRPAKG